MGSSSAGSVACGSEVAVRNSGGVGPARVTVERKPEFWSASISASARFDDGMLVRPRRAFEQFWMCEQMLERLTRDMLAVGARAARF